MNRARILEAIAVILSLGYTVLITYGIVWCWIFALLSSSLYLYICFKKHIYAESLLQFFYLFTAIYGWIHWYETEGTIGPSLPWKFHGMIVLSGLGLVLISGALLKKMTNAATPFIDSFTTVFSIFGTLLMINLVPENWVYWIIIDAVSIYLYWNRKLYLTAGLFLLYTLLSINGLIQWTSLLK